MLIWVFMCVWCKIFVFIGGMFVFVVIFGIVIFLVEGLEYGIMSILVGVYWVVVMMSMIGYGDLMFVMLFGWLIMLCVILFGYGIIVFLIGIMGVELVVLVMECNRVNV